MSQDIFEFWSQIGRGEHVHPADKTVFDRMRPEKHGFRLDCLPGSFGGRLRDAPIVLLYLSPGFSKQDVVDAKTDEGKDFYFRRYQGYEPPRDLGGARSTWITRRTKSFGSWDKVRDKLALLNIGAYHSVDVKSTSIVAGSAIEPRIPGLGARRSVPGCRGREANRNLHAVRSVLGSRTGSKISRNSVCSDGQPRRLFAQER